jgi:hypothetical protein
MIERNYPLIEVQERSIVDAFASELLKARDIHKDGVFTVTVWQTSVDGPYAVCELSETGEAMDYVEFLDYADAMHYGISVA